MTTVTVTRPATVATPRGAAWAADAFRRLLDVVASGVAVLRERRAVAARIAEAAEVRQFAYQIQRDDPRFAADLLAAADRHERG